MFTRNYDQRPGLMIRIVVCTKCVGGYTRKNLLIEYNLNMYLHNLSFIWKKDLVSFLTKELTWHNAFSVSNEIEYETESDIAKTLLICTLD